MAHDEIPELDGWISLAQAAERLGYTKQGAHYLVASRKIETLRRAPGERTLYILREAELPAVASRLGLIQEGPGRWRQRQPGEGEAGDSTQDTAEASSSGAGDHAAA